MSTTDHRKATITGLRALADFLDTNPDVPVPRTSISITYFPDRADDAGMRAEIDHIAELLGTEIDPGRLPYSHYRTGLDFGPVRYEALAVLAAARARHEAVTSYEDCIVPDTTVNPAHAA
ncbi:hypothetical protein [Microbispora hainanensis]|uniref:Uncharacterized protein n=1 Tax=Microbispora hainanensis TaxID=568844 RepID=A0A544Y513_9ACTN|nr:hypothetical protein [Microbispora hainanensis]TQS11857.1 hypothetical protein FLX08_36690 [Microbispora hainanensis]